MSQYHVSSSLAPPPPVVPTSFVTDSGTAVPSSNTLNDLGGSPSVVNNNNGFTTSGSGNTVSNSLTNKLNGTGTTVGAATADVFTFTMNNTNLGTTPGVMVLTAQVCAFEPTTPAGAVYEVIAGIRTTGSATTVVGTTDFTVVEDAVLSANDIDIILSGNDVILRVTGSAGLTQNWRCSATYTYVS
jgi:hypothetical protein